MARRPDRKTHLYHHESKLEVYFLFCHQNYVKTVCGVNIKPYFNCRCYFLPLCQSVMNMMHVISIPYALMKVNPLSWIQKVCQYKGN